jgi:hypothetical protein
MSTIVHPLHYLIVYREGTTWKFKGGGSIFYNPRNVPVSLSIEDRLHRFGLTPPDLMIALFRLNGGRAGYYLANLRDRQYYYCGSDWSDVKATFNAIGIGRSDNLQS